MNIFYVHIFLETIIAIILFILLRIAFLLQQYYFCYRW